MRFCRFVRSVAVLSVLTACSIYAQGPTGTINGIVTDPSGSAIPGASVSVSDAATGATRNAQSNDSGFYSFPALSPATYTVSVEAQGFGKQVRSTITIQVQQVVRVDFQLTVGAVAQSLDVTASAALLSTDDATVGQVIENKRIVDLPLNGRNYLQLTALAPGVTNTSSANNGTSFQGGLRAQQSITANGQRNTFDHFTLDGIENTDPNFNTYILLPSLDALEEFKVQAATYPADYGYGVIQINVTTRSGSNSFHGSGFEFLRNSWFDAKNFFDSATSPIPEFRRNQFGGTLGGPILKNKLFFMANYEGLREAKALTSISTFPPLAYRTGNFTGAATIYDPATTTQAANGTYSATPFPNNVIPSSRFNSIAATAMNNYWPVQNLPGTTNNYVNNEPRQSNADQSMLRIDFRQSDKYVWYGRWNYDKDYYYVPVSTPKEGTVVETRPDQILLGGTQIFTPALVNDVRVGWTRFANNEMDANSFVNDANGKVLHIPGFNPLNYPSFWNVPAFGFNGYSGFGNNATIYLTHNNLWETHDTLSWTHGKHIFKFGGVFEPIHYHEVGQQQIGSFNFNGQYTGNPAIGSSSIGNSVADFLLGLDNQVTTAVMPATAILRSNYWAAYVSDSYRITPKLTLEYGLRWEYMQPFKDIGDMSSNIWGLTSYTSGNPIVVQSSTQCSSSSSCSPYAGTVTRLQNVTVVRDGRMGSALLKPDKRDWAPRLALAYSMDQKTVIRAAYGTYYDMVDTGNATFDKARTLAGGLQQLNSYPTANTSLSNPFLGTITSSNITLVQPMILSGGPPDQRNSYVDQWTVGVQRSLTGDSVLEISYIGSQSHRLRREASVNVPIPGPGSPSNNRPFPQFGFIQYPDNIANGNYNSLAVRLEKRLSHGLTVLSAFTYSKSIDNSSAVRAGSGDILQMNNPYNYGEGERGLSQYNMKFRWVTSGFYQLPFGHGARFLSHSGALVNALVANWQFGGIFTVQSGMPFTALDGTDILNTGGTGIAERPDATGISPQLANPTVKNWFNKAAFVYNAPYIYGNDGRNNIIGPNIRETDLSLTKNIKMTERYGAELRWEVFNATNHPIFGVPNSTLSSASYGMISSTVIDSRQMQVALRLTF
jgi:hypothetical protein